MLKKGFVHKVGPEIAGSILMGIYLELARKMLIKNDPSLLKNGPK